MMFEEKAEGFFPVDETAEAALVDFGFLAPLDKWSFGALQEMLKHRGSNTLEVVQL